METSSPPVANVISLGAHSVPTLRDFYRRLGWPLIIDDEDFAAFELRGAVLALFAVDKLAADGRALVEPRRGGIRFTIGIMVDSRDDVDQAGQHRLSPGCAKSARRAGHTVIWASTFALGRC